MEKGDDNVKKAILERTVTLVLAALAFVAGLAWNDAIQSLVAFLFPIAKNSLIAKFIYALIITAVITFISIRLSRLKSE